MPTGKYDHYKIRGHKGHTAWNKGKKLPSLSDGHKKKIGEGRKERKKRLGFLNSQEARRKQGEKIRGDRNPMKRPEIREKNSKTHIGLQAGEKSPNWKGGISFEPYSVDWIETLRRAIRERDHYVCQLCFQYGDNVHHIDYNKKNCEPENLITLCRGCNVRVNSHRNYWQNYFGKARKKAAK